MANRRMISKSISVSERVNQLSTFAALLYTWMISHADDFGRMPGSPAKIKALVIPMQANSISEVEQALQEMDSRKLIVWYEVDDTKYIQFPGWEKHQAGLHKRTNSSYPEPLGHSEKFPEIPGQENLREGNLREQKEREIAVAQIVKAYEETFGALRGEPNQLMLLMDYMDKGMELELIVTAIHKSSNADVPLKYADSILSKQLRKGIKTVEESLIETSAGGVRIESSVNIRPSERARSPNSRQKSITNNVIGRVPPREP
jgi:DnaD/phage-associated family protein